MNGTLCRKNWNEDRFNGGLHLTGNGTVDKIHVHYLLFKREVIFLFSMRYTMPINASMLRVLNVYENIALSIFTNMSVL